MYILFLAGKIILYTSKKHVKCRIFVYSLINLIKIVTKNDSIQSKKHLKCIFKNFKTTQKVHCLRPKNTRSAYKSFSIIMTGTVFFDFIFDDIYAVIKL